MSTPTAKLPRVLVVEDAAEVLQMIEAILSREGRYEVATAINGQDAIETAKTFDPDVVLLDLGLPGVDGIEVCKALRSFTDAYILMLTARDDEVDRLIGLAVGADDYVTKPFSPRELAARVQVLLRRPRGRIPVEAPEADNSRLVCGDIHIDMLSREVRVSGVQVELTKIEFDLLTTLAGRPDMVFTRELLVTQVWGEDWFGDDHMVSVHIANLRKKIDVLGTKHIKTVRGVGYRMVTD